MNVDEAREFMRKLAQFVFDHHLKKVPTSPQRGMIYEYYDPKRAGELDQWVQGEALDTMHDGAWLAAALVSAYRSTGEPFYKEFLTEWLLPFYCKVLNQSDTLFALQRDDARPNAHPFDKAHLYIPGEKGFVPYWWDDGASVSLERRQDKNPRGPYPCTDLIPPEENNTYALNGYSHGCSNHMAQDLGVMLESAWLLLKDSPNAKDQQLARDIAQAARNLQESRLRHFGHIPMCDAPAGLANHDRALLALLPDPKSGDLWKPNNHYTQALYDFTSGQRYSSPGFADDQEYRYYSGLARASGEFARPLAFRTIYDALTQPLLYRYYCDDAPAPPGMNVFDLHPYFLRDGKPQDYRSERKGAGGRPRPTGSRMGPQNLVVTGWALQALRAFPGIWEEPFQKNHPTDWRVPIFDFLLDQIGGIDLQNLSLENLGHVELRLAATRSSLRGWGKASPSEAMIKIFSRPDGKGTFAEITLKKGEPLRAINERKASLKIEGKTAAAENGMTFEFEIPFTVMKGQGLWLNGIEHGRYSLQVESATRNFYLLSPENQVRERLEFELGQGLRTWQNIFAEKGFIPTGLETGMWWDHFSDAGGCAHLINAAAEWIFYLEGKADWKEARVPAIQ